MHNTSFEKPKIASQKFSRNPLRALTVKPLRQLETRYRNGWKMMNLCGNRYLEFHSLKKEIETKAIFTKKHLVDIIKTTSLNSKMREVNG